MARVRRHADLGSREARRRLRARAEPYWLVIERGMSLGYRKSAEGGAWIVRRYDIRRRRHVEGRIGTADDHRDADGVEVLDFGQAQRKLLADAKQGALAASGQLYTVADAVADYVQYLRTHRKTAPNTESKLMTYVVPALGTKRVAELTRADLDAWLVAALKRRRKARKAHTDAPAQKAESPENLVEAQRRRKATVNRVINAFKGCLNHAYASGKAPSREAWARLNKFRSADSARLRWLTVDEATRLQNASSPDLCSLVAAALLTGCRVGELLAIRARDFDSHSQKLLIANSKSGKPRWVPLTEDGVALFSRLTAGKAEDAPLFSRADGSSWYRMAIVRGMRAACGGGKITPAATFHTLRHTYASHLVQAGMPLLFVASALGHTDTRMVERYYGHLAPSQVDDMIRAKLPRFGVSPAADANVKDLRRSTRSKA
jgi:integrase